MRCFGAWELAMHHARRSSSSNLNSGLMHPNDDACVQLCQAGHASACPLANRESEQTAPRDALLFGSWQCNTYTAICNIRRFAISGLLHPHSDACSAVEQAYVHTSEGSTEKLLALTVPVQWQRASVGSRKPTGPERGMVARTIAPVISRCRWEKS